MAAAELRDLTQVSAARACAFTVVRRVFEQEAYADRALRGEAARLDARDRALATALAYGTVQRLRTLDHVLTKLSDRPLSALQPEVLAALRLGLFQILFMDGIADHAAINESVELVKAGAGRGGAGFTNAVLRRATREAAELLEALDDSGPEDAAVLHSVPGWLAERWWRELGEEEGRALLRDVNRPAESALRVNTLLATVEGVSAGLPVSTERVEALPEALVLKAPFDAHGSRLFERGAIMPQARSSMLVSRILAPQGGQRVLDLCAAPGGKATHLAALMEGEGEVVAVERHPGRAEALRRTCHRMAARNVRVVVADAREPFQETGPDGFSRVLVDPPCSGLGTLRSRPDIRWKATPESVEELAELQAGILSTGATLTAPGGALVYSVCTISRREGPEVVDGFLRENPEWRPEDLTASHPGVTLAGTAPYLQILPNRQGTDGFFVARLRRPPLASARP